MEQIRARLHPHRLLLHRLTAQRLGKQALRVSQTSFFFCFCLCGFGSRLRTRDHLFWRWVCPGTQCALTNTPQLRLPSQSENRPTHLTGSTPSDEKTRFDFGMIIAASPVEESALSVPRRGRACELAPGKREQHLG